MQLLKALATWLLRHALHPDDELSVLLLAD
jgi:hypothetical protein